VGNNGSVNENVAAGAIIIDLNATDVDGDTVSYYFKDGDGTHVQTTADGNFTIDVDTGVVTTARAFDFENDGASLSFTAFAGDGNGGEDSGTYTVPVGNVAAEIQVVDFEDTPYAPIPDGYAGFNWDSNNSPYFADDSDTDVYGGHSGSLFAISPNNELAWNAYAGQNTVIARADGSHFNLISKDFISSIPTTGADQLRVSSYDDGVYKQEAFVDINRTTFTTLELNWDDIDTLYIDVITDEYQGLGFWGMDNLVIT